ncbi:hypothetical protein NDU88_001380 [Pleurodeles waltl]|uniref:Retrotransposon gag domain-containing protein n=1 Tax=Pleurodeles waltl TaxID=8319 RepID=A0AAV7Q5V1_PLEWA|nr:hypothetical protein NDU88_001380 [Pleurodeles waltl]
MPVPSRPDLLADRGRLCSISYIPARAVLMRRALCRRARRLQSSREDRRWRRVCCAWASANPDYERFLLRQARQLPNESVDTFCARLKELACTCTLLDAEDEIDAQFIHGCASVKLRENILQVTGMSMANSLTISRSKELSKVRAAHIEAPLQTQIKTDPVNAITTAVTEKKNGQQKGATSSQTCFLCFCVVVHSLIEVHVLHKARNVQAAIKLII